MDRRTYLTGCLVVLAGCNGTDGQTETDTDDESTSGTATPSVIRRPLGEPVPVSQYGTTTPLQLRFTDRVVFNERRGETEWTPAAGTRYLLVQIELSITDTGGQDLAPTPTPSGYSVQFDDTTYRAEPKPDDTNAIAEPVVGGYATDGGRGAEGSGSRSWLVFEVPESVSEPELTVRYESSVDGRPVVWSAG